MISILIATYGESKWSELAQTRALPSARNQIETEIILTHRARGNVASCRNAAAKQAKGEWLLFLDADDELERGFVQVMQRSTGGINGAPVLLTPRVSYIHRGRRRPARFWPSTNFQTGNWLVIGTLVQRELFMEVGGFRNFPHGLEDWNLWARCVRAGAEIRKVPGAVYLAHYNEDSAHHQLAKDKEAYMKHYYAAQCDAWPELCQE
jgi:glycosyltransferase involved in cell wall biosynthesis